MLASRFATWEQNKPASLLFYAYHLTPYSDTIIEFGSNELLYLIRYLTRFIKYTIGVYLHHAFANNALDFSGDDPWFCPIFHLISLIGLFFNILYTPSYCKVHHTINEHYLIDLYTIFGLIQ